MKNIQKGILTVSSPVETYDNVVDSHEKKDKRVTYDLPEDDSYGYSNEGFDDTVVEEAASPKCEIKNEAKILDIDNDSNIPEENEDIPDEEKEEETFRLTEDSTLFSQLSENKLEAQTVNNNYYNGDNPCQVVEIKAREIVRSVVTAVENLVVPGPDDVEMVQIIDDTDTEPETNSPSIARKILKRQGSLSSDGEEKPSAKISHIPIKVDSNIRKTVKEVKTKRSAEDKGHKSPSKIPKKASKPDLIKQSKNVCSLPLTPPTTPTDSPSNNAKNNLTLEKLTQHFDYEKREIVKTEEDKFGGPSPDLVADLDEVFETPKVSKRDKRKSEPRKMDYPENDYDSFYDSDKDNDEELVFSEIEEINYVEEKCSDSDSSDDDDDKKSILKVRN